MGTPDGYTARVSRRAVTWIVLVGVAGCGDDLREPQATCAGEAPAGALAPFENQAYIAHAGGSPYGLLQLEPYTNSREAFAVSYANGFRAFEFDLIRLADGEVLVAHDYREDEYGLPDGTFPTLTRPEVEDLRWMGKYPVMFAEDLIGLMVDHPDAWIILDTKLGNHAAIAAALVAAAPDDTVRDRMVPHLTSEAHVIELEAVYPFPERMIANYQWDGTDAEQLERMERLGIDNIMMSWKWRWSEETQATMDAAGRHVWVHTPAEPEQMLDFTARGVGVYSDGWIECAVTD